MIDFIMRGTMERIEEQNKKTNLQLSDTNSKMDSLLDAFNAQTNAINRQALATESLVSLLTQIEDNTNPDPKINAPSKRVDMNK